jgi:hypothetical protein
MTRYRHTGMHENILLVVTERPGIRWNEIAKAVGGPTLSPKAFHLVAGAMADLKRDGQIERLPFGGWQLKPPAPFSERVSRRLRRFLLSFPGIPRYGARRSQNASHERNR